MCVLRFVSSTLVHHSETHNHTKHHTNMYSYSNKQMQSPLRNAESMDTLINTHLTFQYAPSNTPQPPPPINTHTHTQTRTLLIHQQHGNEQTSPTLIYHSDWKWLQFDSTQHPLSLSPQLSLTVDHDRRDGYLTLVAVYQPFSLVVVFHFFVLLRTVNTLNPVSQMLVNILPSNAGTRVQQDQQ